jgi:hypothetical protein
MQNLKKVAFIFQIFNTIYSRNVTKCPQIILHKFPTGEIFEKKNIQVGFLNILLKRIPRYLFDIL